MYLTGNHFAQLLSVFLEDLAMNLLISFFFAFGFVNAFAQQIIFEDSFDGEIDESKWKFEETLSGGGDWQFQWFVKDPENAFVRDGVLHLKPTLTADKIGGDQELFKKKAEIDAAVCTSFMNYGCSRKGSREHILNPIRSASIRSMQAFKYGTVEIRAKLPEGDWLRPSIKLLPKTNVYGGWPSSGEIDLLESRGNRELVNEDSEQVGVNQVMSTLHFGPSWDANAWEKAHFVKSSETGFNEDFHIYKLVWDERGFEFLVDDEIIGDVEVPADSSFWQLGEFEKNPQNKSNPWTSGSSIAPFDQEFFISIGLAVGEVSDFFSDSFTNELYAKPWRNDSPKAPLAFWKAKSKWFKTWTLSEDSADFKIDYVKVFSK